MQEDYFNDHQRMVRSDHITDLIDRFYKRAGRDCTDPDTRSAMADVLSVIDAIKLCRRTAHAGLIKLAKFCSSFTPQQFALFFHIVGGGTLIQFANSEGMTEQAAHQMWWRLVGKNPELKDIRRRKGSAER